MPDGYRYKASECDVEDKNSLDRYRAKRSQWLSWIESDEHHAIWNVLSAMVWAEVSFRVFWKLGIDNENSALNNSLIFEAIVEGYFARQILAIRRLVENKRSYCKACWFSGFFTRVARRTLGRAFVADRPD